MELGKAKTLGIFNDHHHGVGDVHPHLDDRGGDEKLNPIVLEIAHDRLFFTPLHSAVQQPDAITRKLLLAEPLRIFLHGSHGGQIPLLHQWADNVGLQPLIQVLLKKTIDARAQRGTHGVGRDSLTARRKLVEHRQIEIAINH